MDDETFNAQLQRDLVAEVPSAAPTFWDSMDARLADVDSARRSTAEPTRHSRNDEDHGVIDTEVISPSEAAELRARVYSPRKLLAVCAAIALLMTGIGFGLRGERSETISTEPADITDSRPSDIETPDDSTPVSEPVGNVDGNDDNAGTDKADDEVPGGDDTRPTTSSPDPDEDDGPTTTTESSATTVGDNAIDGSFPALGQRACYANNNPTYIEISRSQSGELSIREVILIETDADPSEGFVERTTVLSIVEQDDGDLLVTMQEREPEVWDHDGFVLWSSSFNGGAALDKILATDCAEVTPVLDTTATTYPLPNQPFDDDTLPFQLAGGQSVCYQSLGQDIYVEISRNETSVVSVVYKTVLFPDSENPLEAIDSLTITSVTEPQQGQIEIVSVEQGALTLNYETLSMTTSTDLLQDEFIRFSCETAAPILDS